MFIVPFPKTALRCLFTLVAFSAAAAMATPITGVVNLSGSAAVSATAVDFYGDALTGCTTPGVGTDGCFPPNAPFTGDFSTLVPFQLAGYIKDLQGPPISGTVSIPGFMAFVNGITFDLTRVVAGGAPDCATVNGNLANVSCTPVIGGQISPFVLTNSATGTNASVFFNVEVNAYKGTAASGVSAYLGAFNTPSAGKNIAGILEDIAAGRSVAAAYSANFVGAADVPEPDTKILFGLGLTAILAGAIRRRARSAE